MSELPSAESVSGKGYFIPLLHEDAATSEEEEEQVVLDAVETARRAAMISVVLATHRYTD